VSRGSLQSHRQLLQEGKQGNTARQAEAPKAHSAHLLHIELAEASVGIDSVEGVDLFAVAGLERGSGDCEVV